jgi:acetyl-CoA carboxylase biotin carboxyl carrier protein
MNDIRLLARMLSRYDLSELEVEHQGQRIRLRRERLAGGVPGVALAPATPAPFATTQTASTAPKPEPAEDGTALITSPFVGTFYRAPTPEGAPFVEIGQTAKKGHVLCVVEAMKLMNEIEADTTCKILDILVKNGDAVEFGQPLFKITPLA